MGQSSDQVQARNSVILVGAKRNREKRNKKKIRDWDTRKWRTELEGKSTMKWYKEGKKNIQYDLCYTNNVSSKTLARARTNTLQVEEFIHRRNGNHDTTCKLCGQVEEDLLHFIIKCPRLNQKRNRRLMNRWRNRDKNRQLVDLLFNEKDFKEVSQMLRAMWLHRKDLLRPP